MNNYPTVMNRAPQFDFGLWRWLMGNKYRKCKIVGPGPSFLILAKNGQFWGLVFCLKILSKKNNSKLAKWSKFGLELQVDFYVVPLEIPLLIPENRKNDYITPCNQKYICENTKKWAKSGSLEHLCSLINRAMNCYSSSW